MINIKYNKIFNMDNVLKEPLEKYLEQKQNSFTNNFLARKLRNEYPKNLKTIVSDNELYIVKGSAGQSKWTEVPWIAFLNILITKSPQSGFYPVLLYKADMSGVYLSLNQGVTEVEENFKKEAKKVLKSKAKSFRLKIKYTDELEEIDLASRSKNAKFYEAGNIIAKYYPLEDLPTSDELEDDIQLFLKYYEELIYNKDSEYNSYSDEIKNKGVIETKKIRLHYRVERASGIANKVKKHRGHICEACEFDFKECYGALGENYIEAHHLKPISTLEVGKFRMNIDSDFIVLCSNCHRMIHRLEDPSDIEGLKEILMKAKNREHLR